MKEIPLYSTFKIIEPINKGFSSDKKYFVETLTGTKYLLRISDSSEYTLKYKEFESMKRLSGKGVPMPMPIDFGTCDSERCVYTLLEWIEGVEVENCLSDLNEKEQFLLGIKAGKILKKIHANSSEKILKDWSEKYFSIIEPRIDTYKSEGIPFEGNEKILDYLEDNKYLLDARPQSRHHGDFHIGNMILTHDRDLFIIDWHTVDFMNCGDPWYDFNRVDTEFTAFASGQISGYFDDNVPLEFWKLFAYYIATSAITSIVWAKYYSPESLDEILKKNKDVLVWFDNMKTPIPTWYKGYN